MSFIHHAFISENQENAEYPQVEIDRPGGGLCSP